MFAQMSGNTYSSQEQNINILNSDCYSAQLLARVESSYQNMFIFAICRRNLNRTERGGGRVFENNQITFLL